MATMAVGFGSMAFGGMGLPQVALFGASVVGSFLAPGADSKNSNRIDDLKVSSSAYGKGIAIITGTMRATGNMFWATDVVEKKKYINQKGKDITGKKKDHKKGTPMYEYYGNFAMGLCEGPMEEVIRIWADSNLIYDKYNSDNEDLVSPGFSQEPEDGGDDKAKGPAKKKGGKGGESGRFQFRFYTGSATQQRDPFMVEKQGEDLVPAYRGLCYLMFEDFSLMDFGGRIPTITAEVSEKKRQKPEFSTFVTLDTVSDPSPGFTNNNVNHAVMDVVRYRMYAEHRGDDNVVYLRAYDLKTATEVERVSYDDILADTDLIIKRGFQDEGGDTYTTNPATTINTLLGCDAQGNVIMHLEFQRVGLYNPQVKRITHVFGNANSGGSHTDTTVGFPSERTGTVIPYPTLDGMIYYFAHSSLGSAQYFYDEGLTPRFFMNTGIGNFGKMIPGLPNFSAGGVDIYIYQNTSGKIYKYNLNALAIPSFVEGSPGGQDHAVDTDLTLIFDFDDYDQAGTFDWTMHTPHVCVAAECFGFIMRVDSSDADDDGLWAYKIDLNDGSVLWSEKISETKSDSPQEDVLYTTPLVTGTKFVWTSTTDRHISEIDWLNETVNIYNMPSTAPQLRGGQFYYDAKGAIIYGIRDTDTNEYKFAIAKTDRNVQVPATPQEIYTKIALKAGLELDQLDFSGLDNSLEIYGHILEQPTSGRSAMEELFKVFPADVVESDGTIRFVERGNTSIVTINQGDLVPLDDDNNEYVETTLQEVELPIKVTVSYIDPKHEYETSTQYAKRPSSPTSVASSKNQIEVNVPMAMHKNTAKQMAYKILYSLWTERTSYEFGLSWEYLKYDPSDVMTIQMDNGFAFECRLSDFDLGADWSIQAKGPGQASSTYSSDAESNEGGSTPSSVNLGNSFPPLYSQAVIYDMPTITDSDDKGPTQFIYYWGAAPFTDGFRYGTLNSNLGNAAPEYEGSTAYEALWGTVDGILPDPPFGFATDYLSEVTLIPAFDFTDVYTWSSIDPADWISTDNAILIGKELIYFRDATVNADGSITISHLIRMARGTDPWGYDHVAGEKWQLISTGFETASADLSRIDQTWQYRVMQPGPLSTYSPTTEEVHVAASLKPRAPINLRRTDDAPSAGDITIEWNRRSRIEGGAGLRDSTGSVPVNEVSEAYEVYILSSAYDPDTFDPTDDTTYVRMYSETSESAEYTAAEQATDGHTQSDPVHVVVYQISDAVGRGFPGYDTLIVGDTNSA